MLDRPPSDAAAPADASQIAIVGMAGRFPGAPDLETYWANLVSGVETIAFFDDEELAAAGVAESVRRKPNYVRAGARMDGFDHFDAAFFGYPDSDARVIDPQHRVYLETCWEAVEHAGYDPTRPPGSVGVFGGASTSAYLSHVVSNLPDGGGFGAGGELGLLTTRVSQHLNLQGPSFAVQTACSSSLVAVHVACQSLLNYECDMALSGGVAFKVPPDTGYEYQDSGIMSPDGHCRPFDAAAQGTIFNNGVGVVVLKRLSDALDDGDTVYAVILGSAVNNDGGLKASFSAPSVRGQREVIAEALASADVDADTISYVEAHGSGTKIGDSIEIQALTTAFRQTTDRTGFCAVGSVKSNLGHLDAAAGIAGLLKAVLSLRHEMLVPTLHFTAPNPEIAFAASPFFVQHELSPWPRGPRPRRAGVSAFGFGGTNAHVVLGEAPEPQPVSRSRPVQLLVLSARTERALAELTDGLAAQLESTPDSQFPDVAYTLARGRRVFPCRRTVVAPDAATAADLLRQGSPSRQSSRNTVSEQPGVAFLFTGQGSQHPGVARELNEWEPAFRSAMDQCAEILAGHLEFDVRDAVLAAGDASTAERLTETEVAQPALFALEYALVRLWQSWGIEPRAMLGHSLGELVAACVSGVFTLEDALKLAAIRGKLMQAQPPGARLSVLATVAPFVAAVAATDRRPPTIPFVSNVTGRFIDSDEAQSSEYWGRQIKASIEFDAGLQTLAEDPDLVFVEVGPAPTRSSLARRGLASGGSRLVLSSLPHPQDPRGALESMQRTLGELWHAGVRPDWDGYFGQETRRRVALPTHPFDRRVHWLDRARPSAAGTQPRDRPHPLLDRMLLRSMDEAIFATDFAMDRQWVLSEHKMMGEAIVPGTTYLEMAAAAAKAYLGRPATVLQDVEFLVPLLVKEGEVRQAHTKIHQVDSETLEFQVVSSGRAGSGWTVHVRGTVGLAPVVAPEKRDVDAVVAGCRLGQVDVGRSQAEHGVMAFGRRWQGSLRTVSIGDHVAMARLELPTEHVAEVAEYSLHPALLDLATGFSRWSLLDERSDVAEIEADESFFLPLAYESLTIHGPLPALSLSVITPSQGFVQGREIRKFDVLVMDPTGRPLLDIRGFTVKRVDNPRQTVRDLGEARRHHTLTWRERALEHSSPARAAALLVAADPDLAKELEDALRHEGTAVTVLAPTDERGYTEALAELGDDLPEDLIFVASRGVGYVDQLERGVHNLFALARALGAGSRAPSRLTAIVSPTHAVTGDEKHLAPWHAALSGLTKVIGHENEAILTRTIDVDDRTALATILREIAADGVPAMVAYRNGTRYVAELVAVDLPNDDDGRVPVGGLHLITGGLGGLGLEIARHLASAAPGTRLALVSRSPLPPREQWDDPRALTGRQAHQIAAIRELESTGATVRCYAASVADGDRMRDVVTAVRDELGPITTIVHAAGTAGDGFILRKDPAVFRATLAPKALGCHLLDELTEADPPEVMVLFGSTTGLFGAAGQSDYTAANMYLDAFAAYRNHAGRKTITIDWTDWLGTGMAADYGVAQDQGFFKSIGIEDGVGSFARILRSGRERVIVGEINYSLLATADRGSLDRALRRGPVVLSDPIMHALAAARDARSHPDHASAVPDVEVVLLGEDSGAFTATQRAVAQVWAFELGVTEINIHDNLFELGGDSLIALRMANGIQKALGRLVRLADLFQFATVAQLSAHLDAETT